MVDPLRPGTFVLMLLLNTEQRHDVINHIVESWERDQLTTTITEDLVTTYEGDLEGLGRFIENSLGDDAEILEMLKELDITPA